MADYAPQDFDPASKCALLPDQRRRRVRARRAATSSRPASHEDVEKADWDVACTFFSQNGTYRVTGVNEDGRTVAHAPRREDGPAVAAAEAARRRHHLGPHLADSEKQLAFYVERRPRAQQPLRLRVRRRRRRVRLTDTLIEGHRPRGPRRGAGRALQVVRRDGDPEHLLQAAPGDAAGARPRRSSGSTAARAARRASGYSAAASSTSSTTATSCSASTTAAAPATARPSTPPTTRSTAASRSGTASRRRSTCRACPTWTPTASASSAAATAATWSSRRSRSSPRSSPSASTSSASRTGCARSRASRSGGSRSALALYQEIGDPEKDREMLLARSRRSSTPTRSGSRSSSLQGANDPRVIKPESDDIVAAVKKNGVPVEYVVFPDEGHGFTKKKNQIEG